jgi:hypothetical protein
MDAIIITAITTTTQPSSQNHPNTKSSPSTQRDNPL